MARIAIFSLATIVIFTSSLLAEEPSENEVALDRGLAFLAKDAVAWKEKHKCVSCHHAGMVVWAMNEAKASGAKVDEPVLADLTKWIAESGDGRADGPKPVEPPKATNSKAIWQGLALGSVAAPDDAVRKSHAHMLETLRFEQTPSGSWTSWPDSRLPILGHSDPGATALAAIALASALKEDAASQQSRESAAKWLETTEIDGELQSLAMQLALAVKLQSPTERIESLCKALIARQSPDGGWSQTKEMSSDAWATGQAIYALSATGLEPHRESIAKGKQFLIKTQREDGSWPMVSRPSKPGEAGAENLVPITGAGSAWGVMGLAKGE